jgi:hypothetical protein
MKVILYTMANAFWGKMLKEDTLFEQNMLGA